MKLPSLKMTWMLIGVAAITSACTPSGSSSSSNKAQSLARAQSPVFCQNPPYNGDSPLPLCNPQVIDNCSHAQVQDGNGNCVDYTCDNTIVINMPTDGSQLVIPDRTAGATHGTCYAVKLLNEVPNGSSRLTTSHDPSMITRNHDTNASDPSVANSWNPYLMGVADLKFTMTNPHQVDLAGGPDDVTPIQVDNFVVVGITPMMMGAPISQNYYGAFGTSDSGTLAAGDVGYVLLAKEPLKLTPFATGGTATLGPLNLTDEVSTDIQYYLDVRAEDCGGSRDLSNVYVVFR